MSEYSVIVSNVTKEYAMTTSLKEQLLSFFIKSKKIKTFRALDNVSFKLKKGDVLGLVGLNGSGKSTIANLLIEATAPTEGDIQVFGHLELIAIGVGLNNELTGIENIRQKCFMMGMSRKEINAIMPDIIEFSELGDFIEQPLKKYSSGMRSRLGFSISIQTNPDILVVDEALSVGDKAFAQKCLVKIQEMTKGDKTVIFVSHSNQQIKEFCNHVVWLNKGNVIADSYEVTPVLQAYDKFVTAFRKDRNAIPVFEQAVIESDEVVEKEHVELNNQYPEQEVTRLRVRSEEEKLQHTRSQNLLVMVIKLFIVILCFLSGIFTGALIF